MYKKSALSFLILSLFFCSPAGAVDDLAKAKAIRLYNASLAEANRGNNLGAIMLLQQSISANPNVGAAHYNLGALYMRTEKFNEAAAQFKECLRINSKDYSAQNFLGQCLSFLGQVNEGRALLQAVPQSSEAFKGAQDYLAKLNAQTSGPSTTTREKVSDANIQKSYEIEEQAYKLSVANKNTEALVLYKQAISLDPERWTAHKNIGVIYFKRQMFNEAIPYFQTTLKYAPSENNTRLMLGQALLQVDRRDEGMRMLESVAPGDEDYAAAQKYMVDWKKYEAEMVAQTAKASQSAQAAQSTQTTQTAQTAQAIQDVRTNQNTVETVTIPSRGDTPIKDKWALVIGISKFANPQYNLKYASKDAKDFYNYLITEGNFKKDHVLLLLDENATRRNIMAAFGDKFLPAVCMPGDLFMIYVSTHGTPAGKDAGKSNYIIAHDTEAESLYETGVDMDSLYERVKKSVKTDRGLIVMDTCYSGAGVPGARGVDEGSNFDADLLAQGSGHLVMTSSSPSERSWESKVTPNGVFTKYLLQNLRLTKGHISNSFEKLKGDVGWEVQNAFNQQQHPQMGGDWKGKDLILNAVPTAPRQVLNPDLIKLMNMQNVPKSTVKTAPKN